MNAHLEITGGVIRIFSDGRAFGDPYDLAFTVVGDEGVATLKGVCAEGLSTAQRVAAFRALSDAGFEAVRWTRHRRGWARDAHGEVREVRFPLKGPDAHPDR